MKYVKFLFPVILISFYFVLGADGAKKEFNFEKVEFKIQSISAEEATVKGLSSSQLGSLGKPQEWGVIEAVYESAPKWADDVEVRYYVLLKTKRSKKQMMLAGSITYIHVAEGRQHFSNIYVPPQALKRYGEVLRIRAEIWYSGILQDSVQWPKRGKKIPWWTRIKPMYGSLMNRFYTPFEHATQMKEEMIKIQ